MKKFLSGMFLLIGSTCFAQKQNVYFFKNNGIEVTVRDSADYIRVVREPDSGMVNYKVTEVYKNGKPKLVGESSTVEPLTFEGQQIAYYPNSKRQSIENFKAGKLTEAYNYYPTGRLQAVREYPDSLANENQFESQVLVTYNDTTGKAVIVNGEGYFAGYGPEAAQRYSEGKITHGKKEGEWKGNYAADKVNFTEVYKNGRLLSGECLTGDGKKYSYNTEQVLPDLGNLDDYKKAIDKDLHIGYRETTSQYSEVVERPAPPAGSSRPSGSKGAYKSSQIFNSTAGSAPLVHGKVEISFVISKNGEATDFRVKKSLDSDLDQKVLRTVTKVVKNNKNIKPAILFGRPVATLWTMPVSF